MGSFSCDTAPDTLVSSDTSPDNTAMASNDNQPMDVPDAGWLDFGNLGNKFRRSVREDDLIKPLNDLKEKEEELKRSVTIQEGQTDHYSNSFSQRGVCLVLENDEFHENLDISYRGGSDADNTVVIKCFKQLGFEVRHEKNLTSAKIKRTLEKLSLEDHSDREVLAVVVLSHGKEGHLYAYDTQYPTSALWDKFTADRSHHSLVGKPKLFFIQACQGSKMDPGVPTRARREGHDGDGFASYRTPIHADFLVAHSSVEGYYSWRNTVQGSWFIQVLAAALMANGATHDLLTIMTRVARVVATEYETKNKTVEQFSEKKQIPFVYSTLTAKVHFPPK